MSTLDDTVTVYLQRQGVGETLNASFGACRCGQGNARWHVEISPHLGNYSVIAAVCFPNCHSCYSSRSGQPMFNHTLRNTELFQHTREAMERVIASELPRLGGPRIFFHPGVRAYMYYDQRTLQAYPRLRDDYYLASAFYYEQDNSIRRPDGSLLVANLGVGNEDCTYGVMANRDWNVVENSLIEWRKPHHQPPKKDARDGKGWLAWLMSEKLNELVGTKPVIASSIFRE